MKLFENIYYLININLKVQSLSHKGKEKLVYYNNNIRDINFYIIVIYFTLFIFLFFKNNTCNNNIILSYQFV